MAAHAQNILMSFKNMFVLSHKCDIWESTIDQQSLHHVTQMIWVRVPLYLVHDDKNCSLQLQKMLNKSLFRKYQCQSKSLSWEWPIPPWVRRVYVYSLLPVPSAEQEPGTPVSVVTCNDQMAAHAHQPATKAHFLPIFYPEFLRVPLAIMTRGKGQEFQKCHKSEFCELTL